jgi:hypothetical protein
MDKYESPTVEIALEMASLTIARVRRMVGLAEAHLASWPRRTSV